MVGIGRKSFAAAPPRTSRFRRNIWPREETAFPALEDVPKRIVVSNASRRTRILESLMAAVARALSRASGIDIDADTLRPILIFCGAGLLFWLLAMSYGIDSRLLLI